MIGELASRLNGPSLIIPPFSFTLALKGLVTNTGVIPATIHFTEPVKVTWVADDGSETFLGTMELHSISAKNQKATIDDQTQFVIADQAAFGRFSEDLITKKNFTWRLDSSNLRVNAMKFPVCKGIKFSKNMVMPGSSCSYSRQA